MIITCPESSCRAENDARQERCLRCQTPLRGYVMLLNQHHHLFNQGLAYARRGEYALARDAFAAVVAWCPRDSEARNALALAYCALHDWQAARLQWQTTLEQSPGDALARQGLEYISRVEQRISNLHDKMVARAVRLHVHNNGRKQGKKR